MIVEVTQAQRLDEIVFAHYKSLDYLDEVIQANPDLLSKLIIEVGDKVELPVFKSVSKINKTKSLWN